MRSWAYNRFGVLMGASWLASGLRWPSLRVDVVPMITLFPSQGYFCATAKNVIKKRGGKRTVTRAMKVCSVQIISLSTSMQFFAPSHSQMHWLIISSAILKMPMYTSIRLVNYPTVLMISVRTFLPYLFMKRLIGRFHMAYLLISTQPFNTWSEILSAGPIARNVDFRCGVNIFFLSDGPQVHLTRRWQVLIYQKQQSPKT